MTIAPQVLLRDRLDVVLQNRISTPIERIIISEPHSSLNRPICDWQGYALFKLRGAVTLPDRISRELRLNDQVIGQALSSSGVFYESEQGQRVRGNIVEKQYLELYYSLPLETWSKTEAFRWPDAVRDSLSIFLGQSVALLQKNLKRQKKSYTDIRRQRDIWDVKPFSPFDNSQPLDRDRFIGLANFLAKDQHGADVCRRIFLQMVEAQRQKTWHGRGLILSTILEASLRTLEGHPFQPRDRSFNIRHAFNRFQDRFLSNDWGDYCELVIRAYFRLRDRNAHPDWLFENTGALSDEQRSATYNDLIFLSRFYGNMIMAISGYPALEPQS